MNIKLNLIGDEWDKTHTGTKIIVKEDYSYLDIDKEPQTLKKGTYYISGFWCNAMGLNDTLKDAQDKKSKWLLPSKALMFFFREVKK